MDERVFVSIKGLHFASGVQILTAVKMKKLLRLSIPEDISVPEKMSILSIRI